MVLVGLNRGGRWRHQVARLDLLRGWAHEVRLAAVAILSVIG